ncbi:MAG: hypothetical protein ACREA9_14525 [Pyrinomonadaceae bacterium]
MEVDLSKRYQTMITLWFALLLSVVMYFLVALLVAPSAIGIGAAAGQWLIVVFAALGAFFVGLSLLIKQKFLQRSVDEQDLSLVQKGILVACALCEISAILGLIGFFLAGSRAYCLLFVLAATGIAFHFPRLSQLEAASYKSRGNLN